MEFVAEDRVRVKEGQGRFRHLPRAAGDQHDLRRAGLQPGDEVLRARHRPELPGGPEDLRAGQAPKVRRPQTEALLPVDPAIDSLPRDRRDLRLLAHEGGQLREELVEDQRVL